MFDFFSRVENLERITPPRLHFRILTAAPIELQEGARIDYGVRVHGIRVKWVTEIERWNPPFEFVDVQASGPYKFWRHTHRFIEVESGTRVVDIVEYALPFGLLGRLAHRWQVRRDLEAIFDYRKERVTALLG